MAFQATITPGTDAYYTQAANLLSGLGNTDPTVQGMRYWAPDASGKWSQQVYQGDPALGTPSIPFASTDPTASRGTQDTAQIIKAMLASGQITPDMIAKNLNSGAVNPDGSISFMADPHNDPFEGMLMAAAMAAAGSAGLWGAGLGGAGAGAGAASGVGTNAAQEIAALTGSGAGAGGYSALGDALGSVAGASGLPAGYVESAPGMFQGYAGAGSGAETGALGDIGGGMTLDQYGGVTGAGDAASQFSTLSNLAGSGSAGLMPAGLESAVGAAGAGAAGQAAGGAGSALSRILNGSGTAADWVSLLGTAGAGLYGAYTANNQTQAYKDLAAQQLNMGAPYRQMLSNLMANPSSFLSSQEVQAPLQQGTDALMRSLSMQGNPYGSGNALQQGQLYATNNLYSQLQSKENQLGALGGLGAQTSAAPATASQAIASQTTAPNVLGATASNIFNPQPTQMQTLSGFMNLLKQSGG